MPEIEIRAQDLETVRRILREHIGDRPVLAFGSRARRSAKPFSDLDIAVIGQAPLPSKILAGLSDAFDESNLPFKVDVVDWASTSVAFKDIINRVAVPILPLQHSKVTEP
jgi:type I restriction enzyme S subunit